MEVEKIFGLDEQLISNKNNGKAHLNLWNANKIQLQSLGVPAESIEVAEICTYTNSHYFFSARKNTIDTGRFAAGIMIC